MDEGRRVAAEAMPLDPDVASRDRVESADRVRGWSRTRRQAQAAWGVLVERKDILAVIGAGGVLGSLARWGVSLALAHRPGAFAWSTFTVNVLGSFLLGVLMVLVTDVWSRSRYLRPFLGVGVLGGFTTFSTYLLDVHDQLGAGHLATAGVYLTGSLLGGLVSVWLGLRVTRPVASRLAARRGGREDDAARARR